jgi:protein-disulfide isomerase
MIQFLISIKHKRRVLISFTFIAALFFSSVFFHAFFTLANAADESPLPKFGTGNIKVRLYADYFCSPCRAMAPQIEPALTELIKKNVITLTFIDTPFYEYSTMYARYFLYAAYLKKDFNSAMKARNVLIATAAQNIKDAAKLEETLKNKGIQFTVFEAKPIFALFSAHFQDDKVKATPSCVIERQGKREIVKGDIEIITALEKLLPGKTK